MKSTIRILLFLLIPSSVWSASFKIDISKGPYYQGREYSLAVNSDQDISFSVADMPKVNGITWGNISQRSSMHIVNGAITRKASYQLRFRLTASGPLTIPPFPIRVDNKVQMSSPITLDVLPSPFANAAKLDILYNGLKDLPKEIGEEETLTVSMRIVAQPNFQLRPYAWPEIQLEGAKILPNKHPQHLQNVNPNFLLFNDRCYQQMERIVDGQRVQILSFTARLQPTIGHSLKATFTVPFAVSKRRGSTYQEELSLTLTTPDIPIRKLPALNIPDAVNTGLLGKWQILMSTDRQKVAVGSPVALTITFLGEGDPDRLIPIESLEESLRLQHFKVLKKELTKSQADNGQKIIKAEFILIPENSDAKVSPKGLATYFAQEKKYIIHKNDIKLQTFGETSANQSNSIPQKPQTEVSSEIPSTQEKANEPILNPPEKMLDLDHWQAPGENDSPAVNWKDVPVLLWIVSLLLPLIYCASRFLPADKLRDHKDLRARRRLILKRLADKEVLQNKDFIHAQLLPHLAESVGLPTASTAEEIAQLCQDTQLKAGLKEIGSAVYAPDTEFTFTTKKFRKLIKALTVAACFTIISSLNASTIQQANDLFNDGKFAEAEAIYREQLEKKPESSELHYNLANSLFKQNHRSLALAHYLQALHLNPNSTSLHRNFSFAAQSLQSKTNSFGYLKWRDLYSSRTWLNLTLITWCLSWLLLFLPRSRKLFSLVPAFACCFCLTTFFWQQNTFLKEGAAVIITPQTSTFSQANTLFKADRILNQATAIQVLEIQNDLLFVAFGEERFWIKRQDAVIY